jgi:hypothetical protein
LEVRNCDRARSSLSASLIAKNPEIQKLIASGHRLSSQEEEEKDEYKKIVQSILDRLA